MPISQLRVADILIVLASVWIFRWIVRRRRSFQTTVLRGPPMESLVFGVHRKLLDADDPALVYEQWMSDYGLVYQFPTAFGRRRIVLCDPKAVAHFYARGESVYAQPSLSKVFLYRLVGNGILSSEGDSHKRQRRTLTPAFSNSAIRQLTTVFYDSAYKAKTAWDTTISSNTDGSAVIDVQRWMNRISLDTIGIAGFSHDFGTLLGKDSEVASGLDTLATAPLVSPMTLILGPFIPFLLSLPTRRRTLVKQLKARMSEIAHELLEKTRVERESRLANDNKADKSVVGLLIKAQDAESELRLSADEVEAQMNTLMIAGYETTSISLTWSLIELSRHPNKQARLRSELLSSFSNKDPTWDQLTSSQTLPYLNAVVLEILRIHPAVLETNRVATEDDVIPLSQPVVTAKGDTVSSITISKGSIIFVPIRCINRSEAIWGPDAKEFKPERWLDKDGKGGIDLAEGPLAKEIQGHRHLLTFIDGPRTCLGKNFALAEFKSVLSVLIRNYVFEFPDGPETKIVKHDGLLPRPKVEGEDGPRIPLRVRRFE